MNSIIDIVEPRRKGNLGEKLERVDTELPPEVIDSILAQNQSQIELLRQLIAVFAEEQMLDEMRRADYAQFMGSIVTSVNDNLPQDEIDRRAQENRKRGRETRMLREGLSQARAAVEETGLQITDSILANVLDYNPGIGSFLIGSERFGIEQSGDQPVLVQAHYDSSKLKLLTYAASDTRLQLSVGLRQSGIHQDHRDNIYFRHPSPDDWRSFVDTVEAQSL